MRHPRIPAVQLAWRVLVTLCALFLLTQSVPAARQAADRVRQFTRAIEFDFAGWTAKAAWAKLAASSLALTDYLSEGDRSRIVRDYVGKIDRASRLETDLAVRLAGQAVPDPETKAIARELEQLRQEMTALQPLAESIVQEQVAVVLAELGLDAGGLVGPPVAFRFTELPLALIVSPRNVIRQDANIQIDAGLGIQDQIALEQRVEERLNASALVVPVGGIGTYPTMVMESGAISWLVDVVAHEWAHNYLTLRPLGLNYDTTPETRTMNETAASLWGGLVGTGVLLRYYPDLAPPPPQAEPSPSTEPATPSPPPAFDFRAEMRDTRLTVDRLLEQGKIEQAEAYMEEQRQVFNAQGYNLRRLNQAYFAFHGAYADEPGGAAGEDPVGAAVRALWERSPTPVAFLRAMAWMNSYDDLQRALAK
jgi:hypothetical protein